MSTMSISDPNEAFREKKELISFLESENLQEVIASLEINWEKGDVRPEINAIGTLNQFGLVEKTDGDYRLTKSGRLFFGRIAIDLEYEFRKNKDLVEKYRVISPIKIGKNSGTFLAEHILFKKKHVLKVVRPGAADNVVESLKVISGESAPETLIQPIDYFETKCKDIFGSTVKVSCIVFPYVKGETLRSFLNNTSVPINAFFLDSFISQIGGALRYLESINAYHGDFHEENIIVSRDMNNFINFSVIDVSYGVIGSLNSEKCHDNDFKYFIQHIWKILGLQQSYLKKMSLRKYLGARVFFLVSKILTSKSLKFEEVMELYASEQNYSQYRASSDQFISERFQTPGGFKLLRYEEITSPKVAVQLFEPFPELIANIQEFGNSQISGHRGSGKSTYLASLAFFPSVDEPTVSFKEIFGIYFPCRQGEFKIFSSEMIDYEVLGYQFVKHIVVLKVIRRCLEIVVDALECEKLVFPQQIDGLVGALNIFLPGGMFYSSDGTVNSKLKNILSNISRIEMKDIDLAYDSKSRKNSELAREIDLINFFKALKKDFTGLSNTKFYILFDDAGAPNVPEEIQKIINEIMLSTNPDYCIKFTAEKYSYSFDSISGKNLEPGHDYVDHDISRTLLIGGGNEGLNRAKLEDYFRNIVDRRLEYLNYKGKSVLDYLGDQQISVDILAADLSKARKSAYYCGWTTVWNIADRTPRNLLEIVSEIFAVGNIEESTVPFKVKNRDQDKAIRAVSEKRLKALTQISGEIFINSERCSLGRKLFEIASTLGTIYRLYLQSSRAKNRKDEYLAIERNDFSPLVKDADEILKKLITFGVLDESKLEIARDDRVKKPIYVLNKIYCPVFSITYKRDQHLRLSKSKFEELLIRPIDFLKRGTKRLTEYNYPDNLITDMFEDI